MTKRSTLLHSLILAFFIVCLVPLGAHAAEEKLPNAIGEVIYIMGTVEAHQPDGKIRKLDLGSQVIPQDQVVTWRESNVEIRFNDETVYAQAEESTISLDDFVYSDDPSMSNLLFKMGKGTFRFVTGEIVKQNPDAFKLETPLTQIGIRGTEPFAVISEENEKIGVIAIDPAHTVEIKSPKAMVSINKPGVMTDVASDGSLSTPAVTPAQLQKDVIQAAPMTSQGELGNVGEKTDLQKKVKAFQRNLAHEKSSLGGVKDKPDYGKLHNITKQKAGFDNAENERDGTGGAGAAQLGGSDSDGSGGGCGGH